MNSMLSRPDVKKLILLPAVEPQPLTIAIDPGLGAIRRLHYDF